jgi:pimeloyl-ACP methyl ester carboxylesterase
MDGWRSGDLTLNDVCLHYTRTGAADSSLPGLLLAHGLSDSGLCWSALARALQSAYEVVMYDARGHGDSCDGAAPYTREDLAHDAAALIGALRLDGPGRPKPAMLGHSMGAYTAAYTAALYPDLLAWEALEDPPWFDTETAPRWEARLARAQAQERPTTLEGWLPLYAARYPDASPEEAMPWAWAKLQHATHRHDPRPPFHPWQELAGRITCPVLLLTGDPALGAIITPDVAAEALALMPRSELAHIAGAGHAIRREQPAAYLAALQAFIAHQVPRA